MREIQNRIVIWLVVVALCVVVMSLFISRFFTKPIEALNQGILRMTKGRFFPSRVNIRGNNEFAQVGRAFNMMSERLESLDRSRNQFVSNASHELKTAVEHDQDLDRNADLSGSNGSGDDQGIFGQHQQRDRPAQWHHFRSAFAGEHR